MGVLYTTENYHLPAKPGPAQPRVRTRGKPARTRRGGRALSGARGRLTSGFRAALLPWRPFPALGSHCPGLHRKVYIGQRSPSHGLVDPCVLLCGRRVAWDREESRGDREYLHSAAHFSAKASSGRVVPGRLGKCWIWQAEVT